MSFSYKNIFILIALAVLSLSAAKAEVSFSTIDNVEKISEEIKNNFNNLVDHKVFDQKIIKELKKQFEFNLKKLI